jgi:hypothetical protein
VNGNALVLVPCKEGLIVVLVFVSFKEAVIVVLLFSKGRINCSVSVCVL